MRIAPVYLQYLLKESVEILTMIHSYPGHGDVWTVADIKNCYNKILLLIAMQSLLCPV